MDASFIKSLQDRAEKTRARIGIGIWNPDRELMASLHSAERFAELLVVGNVDESCPYEHISTDEPWKELVRLLADEKIDGAVRGNLPAGRTMRSLNEEFRLPVRRLALIELSGWAFLLGPVGIDEGQTADGICCSGAQGSCKIWVSFPMQRSSPGAGGRTGGGASGWTGACQRATGSPPALLRRESMQSIREF